MKRLVLIVALLLLPALSAWKVEAGERPWIAWEKYTAGADRAPPVQVRWELLKVYEDKQRCDRFIEIYTKHLAEHFKEEGDSLVTSGTTSVTVTKRTTGGVSLFQMYCLPDTVDPRGKEERGG